MKRIVCFFVALSFIFSLTVLHPSALNTSAQSEVLIDGCSGAVIHEKNAREKMGMASTTKIMTALVALERCPLDKSVEIADGAIGVEGSSIYLKKGESLTLRQLLYALLLQSANDAATAIALEIGGSIEGFAELMNQKAADLGLKDTHFTNPHGLFDQEHYTTAYELALIAKAALEVPEFREIVSTVKADIPDGNGGVRTLVNHNKLLRLYDGAIGVKTGFTKKTGRCLVSAAERDGTTVIAVTLNAPDDWNDHIRLLDHGFSKIKTYRLASPEEFTHKLPVVGGEGSYVTVTNPSGLSYTCDKQTASITSELWMDRFVFAPIEKGDVMGQLVFFNNGKEIGRIDLIATESVHRKVTKKKLFGIF